MKTMPRTSHDGFTLMELMVTMTIISILSTLALSSYQHYQLKARMLEMVNATLPYQIAIAECLIEHAGRSDRCQGGRNGIPNNVFQFENIASLVVRNANITVTPLARHGLLSTDTYQLIPHWQMGRSITWTVSGGAKTRGLV